MRPRTQWSPHLSTTTAFSPLLQTLDWHWTTTIWRGALIAPSWPMHKGKNLQRETLLVLLPTYDASMLCTGAQICLASSVRMFSLIPMIPMNPDFRCPWAPCLICLRVKAFLPLHNFRMNMTWVQIPALPPSIATLAMSSLCTSISHP